jgi:hypothetical protein
VPLHYYGLCNIADGFTLQETATTDISATQTILATTTVPTTKYSSTTTTHTYAIATAGTGCGDVAYYKYLQDNVVTTQQCLDFCSSMRMYFPAFDMGRKYADIYLKPNANQ